MTQIQHIVQAIQNEFRFSAQGQAFVSIRGAARLAGVSDRAIGLSFDSAANDNLRPLAEFLVEQGFERANLESFAQSGIPDTALSLILEYYGYEAQERYRTQEAKACFRTFSTIGIRKWLQETLDYDQQQPEVPYFFQRLQLFHEKTGRIPDGYFCIFEEALPLISQLERHGWLVDDRSKIDASIGRMFCGFMRKEYNIEPNDYCLKYPHHFPDQQYPVKANLYPIDWLVIFKKWLNSRYCHLHLPKYCQGRKDAVAIEAVNRFLGLLPGS